MRTSVPHLVKGIVALWVGVVLWHQDVLHRPLPPLPSVVVPAPPPLSEAFIAAAHEHRLDADLLARLVSRESAFRSGVCSKAGACGLTQLMPGTAREVGVTDRFDPKQSIHGGAKYLRRMINRYRRIEHAVAAYNCGPGCIDQWLAGKRKLPSETVAYVHAILGIRLS